MLKKFGVVLGLGKSNETRMKSENCSRDVFLGGSCNPTTWRHELAIPKFNSWGITYFNPQVAEWHPELVEVENEAKSNSGVLFFVIDNQTRATSSMVEVANLSGVHKRIIVVIKCFSGPEVEICGETLSPKEFKELCESQQLLHDLMLHQAIPVFSDISKALDYTKYLLKETNSYSSNQCKLDRHILLRKLEQCSESHPIKFSNVAFCQVLDLLEKVFQPVCTKAELRDILVINKGVTSQESYSYSDVEDIISNISRKQKQDKLMDVVISKALSVLRPISQAVGWLASKTQHRPESTSDGNDVLTDVYLGGSEDCSEWRKSVICILEQAGFSHKSPREILVEDKLGKHKYASAELWSVIQNSRVILFNVTKGSRSLSEMVMVSYLIGLKMKNIVLCVQQLVEESCSFDDKLTSIALKDYNRCRTYLKDIAMQHNIPLFDQIDPAVTHIVEMLQSRTDLNCYHYSS